MHRVDDDYNDDDDDDDSAAAAAAANYNDDDVNDIHHDDYDDDDDTDKAIPLQSKWLHKPYPEFLATSQSQDAGARCQFSVDVHGDGDGSIRSGFASTSSTLVKNYHIVVGFDGHSAHTGCSFCDLVAPSEERTHLYTNRIIVSKSFMKNLEHC